MDRLSDTNRNRRLTPEVLERALHSTDIMIVLTDPTEDDNPIVWANDYFCSFTGYSRSDIVGRNCRFLQVRPDGVRDGDQEGVAELRDGVEAGENVHVLIRNYKAGGTLFYNNLFVSAVREVVDDPSTPVRYFVGVQNDATDRVEAEDEVRERVREVHERILEVEERAREVEEATEDERERIGMDLRDGLGQELAGVSRMLGGLVNRLRAQSPAHAPVADRVLGLLHDAVRSARSTAEGLSPVASSPGGLADALRSLAASVSEMTEGLTVRVEASPDAESSSPLDRRSARHLYRIAQQALDNVAEHADATDALVTLDLISEGVELVVQDNGVGIDEDAVWAESAIGDWGPRTERAQQGIGLYGMRYRAELAGGTLTIRRAEGGGTVVRCVVPITGEAADDAADDQP